MIYILLYGHLECNESVVQPAIGPVFFMP